MPPRTRTLTSTPIPAADPEPKIKATFNADIAEREDAQAAPFVLEMGGRTFVLLDALEAESATMNAAGNDSYAFLRSIAPVEDRPAYQAAIGGAPVWLVRDIATAYFQHYGMPVDAGNDSASLT